MFLCRSLGRGGAERQLIYVAKGLATRGHHVTVAMFYDDAAMASGLREAGVNLVNLCKQGRWDIVRFLMRFIGIVRDDRPDLIYAFLPVANIIALFGRLARRETTIIWSLRTAFVDISRDDRLTRFSYWLEARLSGMADMIVANSHAGARYAISRGFPSQRITVIPNGIDTERFQPDADARRRVRDAWALDDGVQLIGAVGRIDPQKDLPTFLRAIAPLAKVGEAFRFAIVGSGQDVYRAELHALADSLGLKDKLIWEPARDDVNAVYNAFDLLVLTSPAEGMPNVIAEAMACGVSAVATDVGDCAVVIGNTGLTVPVGNPGAMTQAITAQLQRVAADRDHLAQSCRERIIASYALDTLIARTEALLGDLTARR
jgi:glycosyltransferase involved in cell wall biosynthesis